MFDLVTGNRSGERKNTMFKFLVVVALAALGLWILKQQLPDIERYIRIRSM